MAVIVDVTGDQGFAIGVWIAAADALVLARCQRISA
jgi:hypothetical protein